MGGMGDRPTDYSKFPIILVSFGRGISNILSGYNRPTRTRAESLGMSSFGRGESTFAQSKDTRTSAKTSTGQSTNGFLDN